MNNINLNDFKIYSALVKGFQKYPELNNICNSREFKFISSKLEEYILSYILKGKVANGIGYDIIDSKILPNKKIEVKSSLKNIIPVKKIKNKYISLRIIISNSFAINETNNYTINSDYIFFNFKKNFLTIFCKAKDIIPYITQYKNKIIFNTIGFNFIEHSILNWPDAESLNENTILNLLKYGTSPMPEKEYGDFKDYIKFCLDHPDINFYKNIKSIITKAPSNNKNLSKIKENNIFDL